MCNKSFLGANLDCGIEDYILAFQLSDEELHNFYRFKAGEGVIHSYGFEKAVPFHTTGRIKDLEVTSEYEIKNSYIDNTRITIESFKECAFCDGKGKCNITIKENANTLAQKFLNKKKNTFEALKKYAETIEGTDESKTCRDNLRKLLKEYGIENQIDEITYNCFLQQVFRIFKRENGRQEDDYQVFIRDTNKDDNTIANRYAEMYYNANEELLKKAIIVTDGKIHITKGQDDKLLKTICEEASMLTDEIFPFFLEKVFERFNSEYGDGVNDDKYNRLIKAIIAKRHFYEKKER